MYATVLDQYRLCSVSERGLVLAAARPGGSSSMMEGEDGEQFICAQCGAAANQRCTGRDTKNILRAAAQCWLLACRLSRHLLLFSRVSEVSLENSQVAMLRIQGEAAPSALCVVQSRK